MNKRYKLYQEVVFIKSFTTIVGSQVRQLQAIAK